MCRIVEEAHTNIDKNVVRLCVEKVLATADVQGTATVIFTSPEKISTLNKQFKGTDKPTDVLSFPNEEHDPSDTSEQSRYLGEIVICPAHIHAQDKHWEIYHLVIHGMFHLTGTHHEHSAHETDTLHSQEVEILDSILKTHKLR